MKKPTHVVIIGAGFAGIAAAKSLLDKRDIQVTIVDRRNHHLFQPLLYQVATSTLSGADLTRSVRTIFKEGQNIKVLYDEAQDFNKEEKKVILESGNTLSYDYLILATGAKTSFFGNNHWAEHVHQMKSLKDSYQIKTSVLENIELTERDGGKDQEKRSTVVIVGGGPTGVELAGAFSDLIHRTMKRNYAHFKPENQKIILIEAQDFLLPPFQDNQREYTRRHLEKLGVEVRTGTMVENIEQNKVILKGGEVIQAGTIIWTAGVEATEITKKLNGKLTPRGLVIVTEKLHIPEHEEVFVIGDCAAVEQSDGTWVPGVAPAANQQGEYVAKGILNSLEGKEQAPFKYKDKGKMAIIGKGAAVVDIDGVQLNGWIGWLAWLFVHVLFLVDFRNKVTVLLGWFYAYTSSVPGSTVFTNSSDGKE